MKEIETQAALRRLSDGELDQNQRARLLASWPNDSTYWRQLALAFVENQVFDEALAQTSSSGTAPDSSDRIDRRLEPTDAIIRLIGRTTRQRFLSRAVWIASIAASLCLGVGLGIWQAQRTRVDTEASSAMARSGAERSSPNLATKPAASAGMPLAEALARAAYPVSVDFRRELLKRGYVITEMDRLSKVELPTGQLVELPVRQVAVTYLGTETYQ